MHPRSKSNASGFSFVKASANILSVGIQRTTACSLFTLSLRIMISMAVLLSSSVGDDLEIK